MHAQVTTTATRGQTLSMHPCPCCGHRTLPERAAYDLCPVCLWEDEGGEPWEYSGPNGQTLVEAQQEYLSRRGPRLVRRGRGRAPRPGEVRDPDWRPLERTPELLARVEQAHLDWERSFDDEARPTEHDEDEAGAEHNARLAALVREAKDLPDHEIVARLRDLSGVHDSTAMDPQLEMLARRLKDEDYYRRHPLQAVLWLARHARPGTLRRRWAELRHGVRFAG